MQALRRMMAQLEFSFTSRTSVFAHSGISANTFSVYLYNDCQPWIINSRAKGQMTCSSHLFSSYFTCSVMVKIRVANESLSSISGHLAPNFRNGSILFLLASWPKLFLVSICFLLFPFCCNLGSILLFREGNHYVSIISLSTKFLLIRKNKEKRQKTVI